MIPVKSLGLPAKNSIKHYFKLNNPKFAAAIKLNIPIRVKPFLEYFKESAEYLEIPVGGTAFALEVLGPAWGVDDRRNESKLEIEYETSYVLRDYQVLAMKALEDKTIGVVESGTGTGKSFLMLDLIKQKQQNTLILVDTIELQNQFIKRLVDWTNLEDGDIGRVGGGKKIWKPITVALLQSMRTLSDKELMYINTAYGLTILDETQIAPANTYYTVLSKLNTKYKFGCSATPERADGLDAVIFWATGPKVHIVQANETKDHIIQPTLEILKTKFTWPLIQSTDYVYLVQDLSIDKARNQLIADHYLGNHKTQTVFLCTFRSQVYALWDLLGKDGGVLISTLDKDSKHSLRRDLDLSKEEVSVFNSFSTKKHRVEVIEGLQSGKLNKVFSTYPLFNKGIDIDTLETMYMCGPTRSKVRVLQSKGRIVRKRLDGKNKAPKIVHVFDEKINLLKWQGMSVHKILRRSIL